MKINVSLPIKINIYIHYTYIKCVCVRVCVFERINELLFWEHHTLALNLEHEHKTLNFIYKYIYIPYLTKVST